MLSIIIIIGSFIDLLVLGTGGFSNLWREQQRIDFTLFQKVNTIVGDNDGIVRPQGINKTVYAVSLSKLWTHEDDTRWCSSFTVNGTGVGRMRSFS